MTKRTLSSLLLAAFAGLLLGGCSAGDGDNPPPESTYRSLAKIVSTGVADGDSFGYSVAFDGDYAVVGAPAADSVGSDRGRAYVFQKSQGGVDGWGQVAVLSASDEGDLDYFGISVDISGDNVVVGAGGENGSGTDQGAAYVYNRDQGGAGNWGQVKKLTASDRADQDRFGYAVAIDADVIVVGADGENGPGTDQGAAYVFTKDEGGLDNWGEAAKLVSGEPDDVNQFGYHVAVDGGYALVGSPREDGSGADRGAAYVYHRDMGGVGAWGLVKKLVPSSPSDDSWFGNSVAIDGGLAVIGEAWSDEGGTNRGAAHIFSRDHGGADNWGQMKKLAASDAANGSFFGYSVSVTATTVAVGSAWANAGGTERGQAYVYTQNEGGTDNWGEVQRLRASDAANEDWFGFSIAAQGLYVLVGAIGEDGSGSGRGAAYFFKKS
jgi:hypothetical protein